MNNISKDMACFEWKISMCLPELFRRKIWYLLRKNFEIILCVIYIIVIPLDIANFVFFGTRVGTKSPKDMIGMRQIVESIQELKWKQGSLNYTWL